MNLPREALSADDRREIHEVLTERESLAASLAEETRYSGQDLARLKSAILEMEASVDANDREGWASADAAFHDELVRLGGNRRVQTIVSNFNDQVRRARAMTLHIRPMPTKSNEDHRALYEAMVRGDARTAREIHWRHRTEAKDMLIQLLNQRGLRRVCALVFVGALPAPKLTRPGQGSHRLVGAATAFPPKQRILRSSRPAVSPNPCVSALQVRL